VAVALRVGIPGLVFVTIVAAAVARAVAIGRRAVVVPVLDRLFVALALAGVENVTFGLHRGG
jgi:hypothetical protein